MWQFLNPVFLWAGLAAAIPLILHMMQRRRVVPMKFSTIRFLKLAQKRSSNRIRMENLLLWLLRTMMLLLLTMAFALLILRTESFGRFMGSTQRDIAIVWDVSYSMGYESGRRNVWEDSRQTVLDLIDGLAPGDRLTLFAADDGVNALIEQPSGDFEQARALVNAQTMIPAGAQLAPALNAAIEALKTAGRREKEIFLVTDGQALAWRDFKTARPGNAEDAHASPRTAQPGLPEALDSQTTVFAVLLGAENPENTAPLSIEVQPPTLMAETPAQLTALIGRTGPSISLSATLNLDGREIQRRSFSIPENGTATIAFVLPPLPAGVHAGWIETPPDGLNLDNRLYFVLRVRDSHPVAVAGIASDVFFLQKALNPVEGRDLFNTEIFHPNRLPTDGLNRFATIFLCNALPLSAQAIAALEHYVRTGGLLVLFPGDRAQARDYESWTLLPAWPEYVADIPTGQRRRAMLLLEPADPLFTGLQLPPGIIPSFAAQRELQLERRAPQATTLVGASGEQPVLLGRDSGSGRVLMFTVSADRRWSDLPLSPFFLPFVHQIVRFGAGLGHEPLFIDPHRVLLLSNLLPDMPADIELYGPDGNSVAIRTVQQEHRPVRIVEDIIQPGIYALRRPAIGSEEPAFAVNAGREESDLSRIDVDSLRELPGFRTVHLARDREHLQRMVHEHRIGRPLSETLLWLVLLISMLELVTANRLSRRTKPLTQKLPVETSGRFRK